MFFHRSYLKYFTRIRIFTSKIRCVDLWCSSYSFTTRFCYSRSKNITYNFVSRWGLVIFFSPFLGAYSSHQQNGYYLKLMRLFFLPSSNYLIFFRFFTRKTIFYLCALSSFCWIFWEYSSASSESYLMSFWFRTSCRWNFSLKNCFWICWFRKH